MLFTSLATCAALLVAGASALPQAVDPEDILRTGLAGPNNLLTEVHRRDLRAGAAVLQGFADASFPHNRVFGSPGHNATVNYLLNEILATGYYDAYLQPQVHLWSAANQSLTVNGTAYAVGTGTYVPNGNVTGLIGLVANLGCNAEDYPSSISGKIALISRGSCTFSNKVAYAGAAGALGAIIYNNVSPGVISGTLGSPSNPIGPYVPTNFISQADGQFFANQTEPLIANVYVNALFENRTTYNVIAETKIGNHDNVVALGAHTDSVEGGPGINDDGSGTIALLTVAKALSKFSVNNAVRFLWWTGEEFGLLGSEYYVANLTPVEAAKIKVYLNFDMLASPNYIHAIYDGDGSAFNLTGPTGSAEIEHLFEQYYDGRKIPHTETAFDGRSDYGPFLDINVPCGGIFTGAEQIKTPAQQAIFGGTAGVAYDACYHSACDNINNLNMKAFTVNAKAVAYAVGTYSRDLSSIPQPVDRNARVASTTTRTKRTMVNGRETFPA